MSDAWERIWLWRNRPVSDEWVISTPEQLHPTGSPEYVRADLYEALTAERDALIRDRDRWAEEAQLNTSPIVAELTVAELVGALQKIAAQKKTTELDTEYEVECADFEGGYDAIIDVARAALNTGKADT
jgi:hypothetical protein